MKIRNGFVSNSSSSSFTCDTCGTSESGWDARPRDFGWFECLRGHVFCEGCFDGKDMPEEPEEEEAWENWAEETEEGHLIPASICPACQMEIVLDRDLKKYLRKVSNITEEEILITIKASNKRRKKVYDTEYIMYAVDKLNTTQLKIVEEIKGKFATYQEFHSFLREK
jgi:hypothetical protein